MAEVMTAASMNVVDTEHNLDEFPHKFNDADYDHAVKVALPVVVAKVDCVDHFSLCQKENIRMYPTLRLFIDGKPWQGGSDYKGHRTVMEVCVCVCVCVFAGCTLSRISRPVPLSGFWCGSPPHYLFI